MVSRIMNHMSEFFFSWSLQGEEQLFFLLLKNGFTYGLGNPKIINEIDMWFHLFVFTILNIAYCLFVCHVLFIYFSVLTKSSIRRARSE
jgi:hypothetical protein